MELQGQGFEPTKEGQSASLWWLIMDKTEMRVALYKLGDANLALHARQRGAEANMDSTAESKMIERGALKIKLVRAFKDCWVVIGRG